jgi:exodeoxyribonuclease-5
MSLSLTSDQQVALDTVTGRLERAERLTVLSGAAGTGKTTLVREILRRLGRRFRFTFMAPTGKAAQRLQEVTDYPACTIHSAIYGRVKAHSPDGSPIFEKLEAGSASVGQVAVIDESSMVSPKLAEDILEAIPPYVRVLAIGDPFQLQPVGRTESGAFQELCGFPLNKPHASLLHVHRQALESPVLRLATAIRESKERPYPPDFTHPNLQCLSATLEQLAGLLAKLEGMREDWVCLVHSHAARRAISTATRKALGFAGVAAGPAPGERLWVRRNSPELGLFNGNLVRAERAFRLSDGEDLGPMQHRPAGAYRERARRITPHSLPLFTLSLEGVESAALLPGIAWEEDRRLNKEENDAYFRVMKKTFGHEAFRRLLEASPGYAITAHAAQGSQWSRVVVVDTGTRDPRWWYTAVTRATDRVLVVQLRGWKK